MATVENLISKIIWLDPFSTTSKCGTLGGSLQRKGVFRKNGFTSAVK